MSDTPSEIPAATAAGTEADLTGVAARVAPKPHVEEIGGRKLKPSTLMMGHGYDPSLSEG